MHRLTMQQLEDVFLAPGTDTTLLSTFWVILNRAKHERGVELRQALERVRMQPSEISVFVEKILQPEDLDDVIYEIEKLSAELTEKNLFAPRALRMLQAWRAKMLMQIVIDKRNAAQQVTKTSKEDQKCD